MKLTKKKVKYIVRWKEYCEREEIEAILRDVEGGNYITKEEFKKELLEELLE